jgi:DNA helicase IV
VATTDADLTTELDEERQHLRHARDCLGRMRERTEQITNTARDELTAWALGRTRSQRLAALTIAPDIPLFFGRLDLDPDSTPTPAAAAGGAPTGGPGAWASTDVHVGRRHIRDDGGEPVVIDWRAPLAVPFYRAHPEEPMGVRRRRFGFHGGELTSFEDEPLGGAAGPSRIMLEEIERPRVGPMRDIVATIQPDQDVLVRSDLEQSLCVQGAPGTGKTAVGLHRAAYLLYTYRERLARAGVLIIGPNAAFLRYIAGVLPALGEVAVTQCTVAELAATAAVRGEEPAAVATLKGDARMAGVLARAVDLMITAPGSTLVVPFGSRRYRIGSAELATRVAELRHDDGLRFGTARDRLAMVLAQRVRRLAENDGISPADRAVERLARSGVIRAFVDEHWPALRPTALLARLYAEPEFLAAAAEGLLDADEQGLLARPDAARRPRWTAADAVLLDELASHVERPDTYGHIVLDEAQDLSAMQFRAVGRRCATGSVTVLGDLAQGTAPWAAGDWATVLAHLGKPDAAVSYLTTGYRVPGEVVELANRLLPHLAVSVPAGRALRSGHDALTVRAVPELAAAAVVAVREAGEGSVGVIAADAMAPVLTAALEAAGIAVAEPDHPEAGERVTVLPASLCKGLEFDHVVLVEPAAIVAAEPLGLRRLYVALTRAVTRLTVLHREPLPVELAG